MIVVIVIAIAITILPHPKNKIAHALPAQKQGQSTAKNHDLSLDFNLMPGDIVMFLLNN